jgi:hypothetical protein
VTVGRQIDDVGLTSDRLQDGGGQDRPLVMRPRTAVAEIAINHTQRSTILSEATSPKMNKVMRVKNAPTNITHATLRA